MNPAVEVFLWIFDEVAGVARSKESGFQGGAFVDLAFTLQICLMLYAMVAHGIHHRLAPLVFFLLYYFKGFFQCGVERLGLLQSRFQILSRLRVQLVLRRGGGCGCQSMHWFWWQCGCRILVGHCVQLKVCGLVLSSMTNQLHLWRLLSILSCFPRFWFLSSSCLFT